MQKQLMGVALLSSTLLLSGCDFFKPKKEQVEEVADSKWSCTHPENIDQLQKELKSEYLKQIDRRLRDSKYYEADQALLKTINDNLKFDIKNIRTATADEKNSTQLQCESELLVSLPKGLQQRAENAYAESGSDCEECDGSGYDNLRDYIEADSSLRLGNDQLSGPFKYDINQTDKDGMTFSTQKDNEVLQGLTFMVMKAVQYAAYTKENKENQAYSDQSEQEHQQQRQLAQKAMDIRNKELLADQAKQVEMLNQTWDNLTEAQRTQLKSDQVAWFEKRDVDCKVISQKEAYAIAESQRETYQQQYNYWDDAMKAQNQHMQYNKCFSQKTAERRVYLSNLFN